MDGSKRKTLSPKYCNRSACFEETPLKLRVSCYKKYTYNNVTLYADRGLEDLAHQTRHMVPIWPPCTPRRCTVGGGRSGPAPAAQLPPGPPPSITRRGVKRQSRTTTRPSAHGGGNGALLTTPATPTPPSPLGSGSQFHGAFHFLSTCPPSGI